MENIAREMLAQHIKVNPLPWKIRMSALSFIVEASNDVVIAKFHDRSEAEKLLEAVVEVNHELDLIRQTPWGV